MFFGRKNRVFVKKSSFLVKKVDFLSENLGAKLENSSSWSLPVINVKMFEFSHVRNCQRFNMVVVPFL